MNDAIRPQAEDDLHASVAQLIERVRALQEDGRHSSRSRRRSRPESPRHGPSSSDLRLYGRLLLEARRYWLHIGAIFGLAMLATPIALVTPLPLKIAVDSVIGKKPLPGLVRGVLPSFATGSKSALLIAVALLFVLVQLLGGLQQLVSTILGTYTGEKLQMRFRERLFRHVQRLSFLYHDARGTADSVYRIQYDAASIQWIAVYGVTPFLTSAVTLVAMIYIMARIDMELALVAVAVSPLLFFLTRSFRPRLKAGWKETKNVETSALSVVQEVLTGLRVVKAFGQEEREGERFLSRAGQGMRMRIRLSALESLYGLLIGLTTTVGTAAVLYIGVRHVQSGRLSLGSLLLVMGYLSQLYVPLQTVSKTLGTLQSSIASAERVFTVLDETPDVEERPDARPLARAAGHLEFRDVSFEYRHERPVLDGISLDVPAGARVGIAGATGAGKTTLVSLLTRFYDPTEGEILLDGVDLRDYRLADLRNQFAIVLQEPVLFSTTIAENIAYGRPNASGREIEQAARAANADEFITRLPDGYDTIVGERGMTLSGGERQRVSLARAFLKDAPILILDEPTSSVDLRTEATIMEAMGRLMKGRTTFMIAHRLSTLEHCDVRVEISGGHISRPSPVFATDQSGSLAEQKLQNVGISAE